MSSPHSFALANIIWNCELGARFIFYKEVQNIYIMTTDKHPTKDIAASNPEQSTCTDL